MAIVTAFSLRLLWPKLTIMNEEDFKNKIEERWGRRGRHSAKGRIWVGVFLVILGALFLARNSGVIFPTWFFTWPMILIAIGIFSGIRHGFRHTGWLFPIFIGGIFLADEISTDITLRPYFWPIVLIVGGLFIILRPKRRRCGPWNGGPDDNFGGNAPAAGDKETWTRPAGGSTDALDITAIFGGVKKNVLSKTFKGGDVVAFMGGAEINLTQADFTGKVVIDCFNMFGGTKIIVPPDWEIQNDVVAIFGGVDDKRPPAPHVDHNKVLFLDGTCIFGGLEIRSY